MNQLNKGSVVIAGAGPGDPELITVKAVKWLQCADVVLTDRLVSQEILDHYTMPGATIIKVGKQGGKYFSTSQQQINDLMVHHANKGKLVVRLKGGDISVFSNILDELETLVHHHIPYLLIPGITAAAGAAASSGIPLTARDYAQEVRFLTCFQPESFGRSFWKELAGYDDTQVLYMSGASLDFIIERLIENKISDDKHIAVIEQATTPNQNITVFSAYDYDKYKKELASPTLIIIGKVVQLHHRFRWIQNNTTSTTYFDQLESRIINCDNPKKELLTA